jgi:hypothetical protein
MIVSAMSARSRYTGKGKPPHFTLLRGRDHAGAA